MSPKLVFLDASVLFMYSLSVSSLTLMEMGLARSNAPLLEMPIDLRYVVVEFSGALSLAFAWLVAASKTGALDESWLELEQSTHKAAPLGIARVVRTWSAAVPLFAIAKTIGIAGINMPLGAGMLDCFAWPLQQAAISDVAGMLLMLTLSRRLLLQQLGRL